MSFYDRKNEVYGELNANYFGFHEEDEGPLFSNLPEVIEALESHSKWATSEGKEGERFIGKNYEHLKINFSYANLEKADFSFCDFQNTNFYKANLVGADFKAACLEGANFIGANLTRANLTSANVENAFFRDAILTYANLSDVCFCSDFESKWPGDLYDDPWGL